MSLQKNLKRNRKRGLKSFAVLLDPDKVNLRSAGKLLRLAVESKVDYFFVGGSLITNDSFADLIELLKRETSIPVIIFPGSNLQLSNRADGILFLSLISGRNPEYLIGQHVAAAPSLKKSKLEVLPTGYILVDCGKPTTVSYISNTTPIPYDKPSVAACTAMAGELLGMKLIYMDGGSGASKTISVEMISQVKQAIKLPLIVGGGIKSVQKARSIIEAGADIIVVGNAIEDQPMLLTEIAEMISEYNASVSE